MKPLIVKDLKEMIKRIPSKYDNLVVLVSDDDEQNGYHALWYKEIYSGDNFEFFNQDTKEMETRKSIVIC